MLDRAALENIRRVVIILLNLIDDALGQERTIAPKEKRRKERRERKAIASEG